MSKPHGSVSRHCLVCGTVSRRSYCALHDPYRDARKASNTAKKSAYQKRIKS